MENTDKKRFAVLALFIVIAALLGVWSIFTDAPTEAGFATNLASIIAGLFIIPLVYKIAKEATDSAEAGLFAAALALSIPLYSWRTVGQLAHTLSIGFFFLTILLFILLKEIGDWKKIIVVPLIFAFVHVYSMFLIPVLGLYLLFSKLEDKKPAKNELIFIGLSSLFIFLIFLFFTASPALFAVAQQYVNTHYYAIFAETFTLAQAFALAGMLPIYIGFLGSYYGLKTKKKTALLLLGMVCVFFVAMATNLIPIMLGLTYFTITLAILSSFAYEELKRGIDVSRFKNYSKQIAVIIFTIVVSLGVLNRIFT